MQAENTIPTTSERRSLSDFVPLVFAFFLCLTLLSLYQHLRLYIDGVLDGFLNKSLLLLMVHNLGFAAIAGLLLAFLFNFLEGKKAGFGLKAVKIILFALLVIEGLLIEYYVREYEILENTIFNLAVGTGDLVPVLSTISIGIVMYILFMYLYNRMSTVYRVVSRMYPFTIVLFSLFLAILNSDKKPINANKTQYFLVSVYENLTDFNTYEGTKEFPLAKKYQNNDRLGPHFNLNEQKPNIVVLLIDGLGADFIGESASYPGFTPFLEKLSTQSLYWENYLSNSGVGYPAMTSITGSLPFGETGFTNADNFVHRQTLFSLLKKNGYRTGFYYGGNASLNHFDRYFEEEQVDLVLDKKGFGNDYTLQTKDGAGITLGYPDKELFKKWSAITTEGNASKFEVFQTISTRNPYAVPNLEAFQKRIKELLKLSKLPENRKRLVSKNKEIFASMLYMDEAVEAFMTSFKERPEYQNTIFVITGSHSLSDLPQYDELGRYRVPLLVFSPMLKHPQKVQTLASHADITPSLVQLLDANYDIHVPDRVAWLGDGLISDSIFSKDKSIPLFRDSKRIKEYILGNHLISTDRVSQLTEKLRLKAVDNNVTENRLKSTLKEFKAINSYVIQKDKLIPIQNSLVVMAIPQFSKTDLVWIESMFNGKDFDDAYGSAKKLAFGKEWERALLLCNYILSKIPGHADTEILMGRIHAWKTDYLEAERLLKKVVQKYPVYEDGYAALFDVYFWSKQPEKAIDLKKIVKSNNINSSEIIKKVYRAEKQLDEENLKNNQLVTFKYE